MTTSEGPAYVEARSRLANTFPPEEQEEVLRQINGFKGDIQQEILKRSSGDLSKIPDLVEHANESAFDIRMCRDGLCFTMPPDLKAEVMNRLEASGQSLTVAAEAE